MAVEKKGKNKSRSKSSGLIWGIVLAAVVIGSIFLLPTGEKEIAVTDNIPTPKLATVTMTPSPEWIKPEAVAAATNANVLEEPPPATAGDPAPVDPLQRRVQPAGARKNEALLTFKSQ